ncbi:MAG TPA: ABC transporter substrate-binding protein [bacterium]|nr:ABC transporter substrate-binding protein [bacterium]
MRGARALILCLGLGVLSLAGAGRTATPAGAAAPVRMGYLGVASDAGIFIALEKGYFKEQGLDLSLERFGVGADQMALLGSGRLDIASGAPSPTFFNAINRGLPVVVVADKGSLRKGFGFNVLVVRKGLVDAGQFRGLGDLRGRVLGTASPASIVNFENYLLLRKGGLTAKDVAIEYMEFVDQPAAMANGKIDAAVMVEPFATAAESRGIGKIVMPLDQILPDFQTAAVYYNTQWAREHPGEARGWMVAYVKALRYYNESLRHREIRDDVITIMAGRTPIKDRAVWDRMIWPGLNPDGAVNVRTVLDYQRWLLNERLIGAFVTPARFVDLSYVEQAASVLGAAHP